MKTDIPIKGSSKISLYDKVFGNVLETHSGSPTNILKRDANRQGQLPSLLEYWKEEIEQRKKGILELEDLPSTIEFAELIHDFYRCSMNLLNLKIPQVWIHKALLKAEKALWMAQPSNEVNQLFEEVQQALFEEGIGAEMAS